MKNRLLSVQALSAKVSMENFNAGEESSTKLANSKRVQSEDFRVLYRHDLKVIISSMSN